MAKVLMTTTVNAQTGAPINTFSVTAGDNITVSLMVRADRDLASDETLTFKVFGASNENREVQTLVDVRADRWKEVIFTHHASVTESVTIAIGLIMPTGTTTHPALVTYIDDVSLSINTKHNTLLRNDTGSTRSSLHTGVYIPNALFNQAYLDVGTDSARVGGALSTEMTTTQTTAVTTEESLSSYTLPARAMWKDGQGVRIKAWGTTAANTNAKTLRIRLGGVSGTILMDTGAPAANNTNWVITAEFFRTSETTQESHGEATHNGSVREPNTSSPTEDLTTSLDIVVTGQNSVASAGDIVHKGTVIEYI